MVRNRPSPSDNVWDITTLELSIKEDTEKMEYHRNSIASGINK